MNIKKIIVSISGSLALLNGFVVPSVFAASKDFSVAADLTYGGNTQEKDQPGATRTANLSLASKYQLNLDWSLGSLIEVEKNLKGDQETTLGNIPVNLTRSGFRLFRTFELSNLIIATLPTNKVIVEEDTYRGAIGLATKISHAVKALPLTTAYQLTLTRGFHEFTVDKNSEPNVAWTLSHRVDLSIDTSKSTNLGFTGAHRTGRTYNNFERSTFLGAAEFRWQMSPTAATLIGTSNEGSTLAANGRDSNIELYDEKSSVIYAGFGFSF